MCGIFAYSGTDNHSALKALRGLKDLEYRGYDSWGIAVKTKNGIFFRKAVGKVSLVPEEDFKDIDGITTLGHTRWATHGGVSLTNSHPHFNQGMTIAVVHNGIIENYKELREELLQKSKNHFFRSETDTEVIPHLIDFYLEKGYLYEDAFNETCRRLRGRFAFVVMHASYPFLLAARSGSPLLVGRRKNENFIASDIPAFLDYTNVVNVVNDGEALKVLGGKVSFWKYETGRTTTKKSQQISWAKELASKGGYEHFMMKEIMQQKESMYEALRAITEEETKRGVLYVKKAKNIIFTACGTAGHTAALGEYFLGKYAGIDSSFIQAGEFERKLPFVSKRTVIFAVSQSGETADVLDAADCAQKKGAKIFSVLNVRGSSLERESDVFYPINAGPEKAVASTKAASGQLIALLVLALLSGEQSGERIKELRKDIEILVEWLSRRLLRQIEHIAEHIKDRSDLFVIGRGSEYSVALEAALKIKEVSYIHAEGFSAGELKHGPIALIEDGVPCLVLQGAGKNQEEIIHSASELKTRGAWIIGIAPEHNNLFDAWIKIPHLVMASPLANLIVSQIFAYYLAVFRDLNPDMPRNLAKSVTVK